ncbi:hypothetical protein WJX79_010045 [Trebouxia sp. C0005]
MYSEGRLTRSRARSQGIESVEELPFISTKGKTTSKKPGRAAFLDVTNDGSQPLRSEDSSGSVKNLCREFEPAEVLTESDRARGSETLAVVPESPTKMVDTADLSSLGAMPLNYEQQSPHLASLVCTKSEVPIPQGKNPEMTGPDEEAVAVGIEHESQDVEEHADSGEIAASLPSEQSPYLQGSGTMLDSFGNDSAITSVSTPQALNMPMDIKAESQASEYPTPGQVLKASDPVSSAGDAMLQHGMGTNDLPASALKASPTDEEEMPDSESLPPASPDVDILSRKDGASAASADTSLTPMAKFEAGKAAGLSCISRGKGVMSLNETPSQSVNMVGPVNFFRPDSPAKEETDSKRSNQTAAPTGPSPLVQPASGAGSTPSQNPAELAEKDGMPESSARDDLEDRWEMDFEVPTAPSNTYAATIPASKLESKIHASPSYDPRSLRQLRKEVATKLAKAAAVKVIADNAPAAPMPVPAGLHDYESQSDTGMSPGPFNESPQEYTKEGDDLCNALGSLDIQSASKSKEPLRGLPVPQGMHIRFDDDGQAMPSPGAGQIRLRGVPAPRSSHIRFD